MAERSRPANAPTPRVRADATETTTARITLSAEAFALAGLFERVPAARIECEPAVANPTDHALVVVRADENDRGAVETAIEHDKRVAAEFLADREDGWAYRVTWGGHPHEFVRCLVAADVTILSMRGYDGEWRLRLLAPGREGISRAYERIRDFDDGADCLSVSTIGDNRNRSGLTDSQREALLTAFEMGYFDIPRDVTANDVADELDISHQALSERFRRAHRRIIENEFPVEERYS